MRNGWRTHGTELRGGDLHLGCQKPLAACGLSGKLDSPWKGSDSAVQRGSMYQREGYRRDAGK